MALLALSCACIAQDKTARFAVDPSELWRDAKDVALARAIIRGDVGEIDRLVSAGADVNAAHKRATGRVDMTLLAWAMLHGQQAAFESLLEHGADPSRPYEHYGSLLHAIAERPDDSTWLSLALKHKADPNFGPDRPLIFAAILGGRVDSVKLLIKVGAKVDVKLDDDTTPLLAAAASGVAHSWEMVDCLLLAGADYRARNQLGRDLPQLLIEQMALSQWQRPNAARDKVIDWLAEKGISFRAAEMKLAPRESERAALNWWCGVRDARWAQWAAIAPETAGEYLLRGSARRAKGEFNGAIADFSKALEIAPKNAAGYKLRGDAWYDKAASSDSPGEDYARARADYTEALRLDPGFGSVYAARAKTRLAENDAAGAVLDYTDAIRLDPNNAALYWRRGDARCRCAHTSADRVERADTYAQAIADCDEAIRRDPRDPRGLHARGQAWYYQAKYDKAIDDHTAAIKLDPDYALAYSHRGEARSRMASIATDPRKPLSNEAAALYSKAVEDFTSALKLDPRDDFSFGRRGDARRGLGDYDNAIKDYDEAIRLDPYTGYYVSRAETLKAKGDIDAAIADLTTAIDLNPSEAWSRQRAYTARGDLWFLKKCHERAIADYTQAKAFQKRRDVWTALGEYKKVIDDLAASTEREPTDPWNFEKLSILYATCPKSELRDRAKAVEFAEKACEATGWRDAMFLHSLARVCAETGDFQEAVKWERKAIELAKLDFLKQRYRKALASYETGEPQRAEDKK